MKKLILTILICGFAASALYAQSAWLSDTRLTSIALEWDKPLIDDRTFDRDDVSGASSALFLTGRIRATDNFRFVTEIPVSHFGFEGNNPFGGDDNSTVLGNIYVGGIYDIETSNPNNHAFLDLGVRIPTTPEPTNNKFGGQSGMAIENSDRMEAFMYDTWSIPLIANFVTSIEGPFAVKARVGNVYNILLTILTASIMQCGCYTV
jgi:hypothetical protein